MINCKHGRAFVINGHVDGREACLMCEFEYLGAKFADLERLVRSHRISHRPECSTHSDLPCDCGRDEIYRLIGG